MRKLIDGLGHKIGPEVRKRLKGNDLGAKIRWIYKEVLLNKRTVGIENGMICIRNHIKHKTSGAFYLERLAN